MTTVPTSISDDIESVLWEFFVTVRTDYSGRGMRGDSCLAVVVDGASEAEVGLLLGIALANGDIDLGDADSEDFIHVRTDDMGRGWVMYWPRITVGDKEAS